MLFKAQTFGFCVIDDAIIVRNGEGSIARRLTVYADRSERTQFAQVVRDLVGFIGHEGGQTSVLVEVNGSVGLYEIGVDYEPPAVSQTTDGTFG